MPPQINYWVYCASLGAIPVSSATMAEKYSYEGTYITKELSFLPCPGLTDLPPSRGCLCPLHHRHGTKGRSPLRPELFLKEMWEKAFPLMRTEWGKKSGTVRSPVSDPRSQPGFLAYSSAKKKKKKKYFFDYKRLFSLPIVLQKPFKFKANTVLLGFKSSLYGNLVVRTLRQAKGSNGWVWHCFSYDVSFGTDARRRAYSY